DAGRIYQLNDERTAIVSEVVERVLRRVGGDESAIELAVNDVAFHEIARLEPDPRRAEALRGWLDLYRTLGRRSAAEKQAKLRALTEGYGLDIAGHFTPWVYRFATGVIPRGLSLLFRRRSLSNVPRLEELERRISVQGQTDALKRLARRGTVILAPTHSSNLDSIVVGFALDRMGLPPFTYGAGKNLFANPLVGFFMHNLGAYRVDRRLRNTLYKEVLKTYSTVVLERGYHSLFFPGGTRSRSGAVERRLKLGLLGTGLAAYTNNVLEGRANPNVYIVPMTINYPLVLEGATQIEDHLRAQGKSRYIIEDDEFARWERWLAYARSVMNFEGQMVLRFGEALDPFGNPVDAEGTSRDPHGRPIELSRYLTHRGVVAPLRARDDAYTRQLGEAVQASFLANNVVLSTHLVAFTLYELARTQHPTADLYHLMRLPGDTTLPITGVMLGLARLRERLLTLAASARIHLSETVASQPYEEVFRVAMAYFQMYHTRPLAMTDGRVVALTDMKLLFYYHNRLTGYGLERLFSPPCPEVWLDDLA
ncbi:MAG: 1-acyl-sn-glycerol-3-phosphate acyltransferase, partial [Candidatus Sericytochromatia bacterium]|nr:1-acyl-sn-glycerol-3-phosphate acyltransferase [Candidatus Sericytochromatia bacterium]